MSQIDKLSRQAIGTDEATTFCKKQIRRLQEDHFWVEDIRDMTKRNILNLELNLCNLQMIRIQQQIAEPTSQEKRLQASLKNMSVMLSACDEIIDEYRAIDDSLREDVISEAI